MSERGNSPAAGASSKDSSAPPVLAQTLDTERRQEDELRRLAFESGVEVGKAFTLNKDAQRLAVRKAVSQWCGNDPACCDCNGAHSRQELTTLICSHLDAAMRDTVRPNDWLDARSAAMGVPRDIEKETDLE